MLTISTAEPGTIDAQTPYEAKDRIKKVPGGRWAKSRKRWAFAASPLMAKSLIHAVGQYGVSPEVQALADSACTLPDVLDELRAGAKFPKSDRMRFDPRENQIVGTAMFRRMGNAIFAWDMGGGKTYGFLSALCDVVDRAVAESPTGIPAKIFLTCPPTLVTGVWTREISKHLVDWRDWLEVSAMPKGTSTAGRRKDALRRLEYAERGNKSFLLVTGLESCTFKPVSDVVSDHVWDLGGIDEAHRIASPNTKIAKWVHRTLAPRVKHRIAMTGTLFRTNELDAFTCVRFVEPAIFGSNASRFRDRFASVDYFGSVEGPNPDELDELRRRVGLVAHFKETRDMIDLPKLNNIYRRFPLEDGREAYDDMEKHQALEVEQGTLTAANGLVKLLRLQQITSGFLKVESEEGKEVGTEIDGSKQQALEDMISEIPTDRPVVVFTIFKSDARAVARAALNLGRKSFELSGDANELHEWQEDTGPSILAAQAQSAGVGVDLTRANHAIFYSCGFSWSDHNQCRKRIDRPGQTRPMFFGYLIAEKTVDESVIGALIKKRDGVQAAIDYLKGEQGEIDFDSM